MRWWPLLFILFFVSCGEKEKEEEIHGVTKARKLLGESKYDEAIEIYQQVLNSGFFGPGSEQEQDLKLEYASAFAMKGGISTYTLFPLVENLLDEPIAQVFASSSSDPDVHEIILETETSVGAAGNDFKREYISQLYKGLGQFLDASRILFSLPYLPQEKRVFVLDAIRILKSNFEQGHEDSYSYALVLGGVLLSGYARDMLPGVELRGPFAFFCGFDAENVAKNAGRVSDLIGNFTEASEGSAIQGDSLNQLKSQFKDFQAQLTGEESDSSMAALLVIRTRICP